MTTPNQQQVPNPARQWLAALLSRVQSAVGAIPTLDGPTASIGPGPAWTGSKALSVHDNELAPVAKPFSDALGQLAADVQDALNREPMTVTATTAKLMRIDYEYR